MHSYEIAYAILFGHQSRRCFETDQDVTTLTTLRLYHIISGTSSRQHSTSILEEEAVEWAYVQVQGDGIRYVEWDSRHPSPGLCSESGRRVLLFGQLHISE